MKLLQVGTGQPGVIVGVVFNGTIEISQRGHGGAVSAGTVGVSKGAYPIADDLRPAPVVPVLVVVRDYLTQAADSWADDVDLITQANDAVRCHDVPLKNKR